jgi:tRNA pseudouridine55 synthase
MSHASAAAPSGVLNIDKPAGWTSHDVVAKVRRLTGVRQVGHAGTLDPMATGVLVVCVGQATRLVEYVTGQRKVYLADITFGVATDTYDATGRPSAVMPVPALTLDEMDRALEAFRGAILQTPPVYSALKQDGEALYKRARRGEQVEVKPRPVTIYELAIVSFDAAVLRTLITCSAGTYVRSIAHDLGQALDCGAHLSALQRLAVGDFTLPEAITLEQLGEAAAAGHWQSLLLPPDSAVAHLPRVVFNAGEAQRLLHGQFVVGAASIGDLPARACDASGHLLAIVQFDWARGVWRPQKVFAQPE